MGELWDVSIRDLFSLNFPRIKFPFNVNVLYFLKKIEVIILQMASL